MKTSALPFLAAAVVALSAAGCSQQQKQPAPPQTSMAPPPAAAAAPTTPPAMSPHFVREIQNSLNTKGYNVAIDGVYGSTTQAAVEQFQRRQNLNATGQIDGQTLAALGLNPASATGQYGQAQPPGQQGYTPTSRRGTHTSMAAQGSRVASAQKVSPEMMRNIQQDLKDRGYNVGRVDGVWGPRTHDALIAFQRDQRLQANGRIDQRTLAALGVGAPAQQTGQLPPENAPQANPPPAANPPPPANANPPLLPPSAPPQARQPAPPPSNPAQP